jgi:predicted transcriptional regulator
MSLSGKPVIISYLLEVVEGLKKAPQESQLAQLTEWQIYKMILDQLMLRDLARSPEISPIDRRRFLQKLAMHLSRKDMPLITEEDFKDLVSKEFRKQIQRLSADSRHSQVERLFADLRSSATLTSANDPTRNGWRFSHNSLREFLVVEQLVEGLQVGPLVSDTVPISDAMRLFCASMPTQEIPRLVETLATEWQKPENRRGCSQLLSVLWDAFRPHFDDGEDTTRKTLKRITGEPIALNMAELSRLALSNEQSPAVLDKANFAGSSLIGVDLSYGRLKNCDFSSAYLENVRFANATLDGAAFSGSVIVDCDFTGCSVKAMDVASIQSEDISIIVESGEPENVKGMFRRLEGIYAIGFLKYAGAKTGAVPDFAVYCHHRKFAIVKKILEKLSEQTLRQRMGLEKRGAARADVPFAKKFIQKLEEWGFIGQSARRKDLVEVTELGREQLTEYVRTDRLPDKIVGFLKDN